MRRCRGRSIVWLVGGGRSIIWLVNGSHRDDEGPSGGFGHSDVVARCHVLWDYGDVESGLVGAHCGVFFYVPSIQAIVVVVGTFLG